MRWKRSTQRLLSLALIFTILASFIPAPVTAADVDAADSVSYCLHKRDEKNWQPSSGTATDIRGITSQYTDGWSLYGWSEQLQTTDKTFTQYSGYELKMSMTPAGTWAAFQIRLPQGGHWAVDVNYKNFSYGGVANLYLIPVPQSGQTVESLMTDERKLGSFESKKAGVSSLTPAVAHFDGIEIFSEGDYLLVFEQADIKNGIEFWVTDVVFTLTDTPAELVASLPAQFVEVGQSAEIALEDARGNPVSAGSYVITSRNPEIATVSGGRVTGVSIGRATLTIIGDQETTLEIPVVGENLLTRNGVENGSFADGAAYGAAQNGKFWNVYQSDQDGYMDGDGYSFEIVEQESAVQEQTHVLKLSSSKLPDDASQANMRFSLRSGVTEPRDGQQLGGILIDSGKMYELSGWAKAENTKSLLNAWSARTYYYAKNDQGSTVMFQDATNAMQVYPWTGRTQDQDWTYFATIPLANDELAECAVLLQPRIEGSRTVASGGWIGDILFADLSMHEVQYDRMRFAASGSVTNLRAGDTVNTNIKHYSTTGQEIKYLKVVEKAAGVPKTEASPVPVQYSSSDAFVARVNANGVISAIGGGNAIISATATIGGVTQTQKIAVSVAGAPASRELASVALRLTPDTVRWGESAEVQLTGLMADNMPASLEDADIHFTFDESIVSFDENGQRFTGIKEGTTEITASVTLLGYTKTASASLTVLPPALAKVILKYESNVLPVGGSLSPAATGTLTDGAEADLRNANLSYTSSNPSVLQVDEATGVVTGTAPGSAAVTISAELGGVTQEATVRLRVTKEVMEDSGVRVSHELCNRSDSWNPLYSAYENDIRGITAEDTDGWSFYGWSDKLKPGYAMFYQYDGTYLRLDMNIVGAWAAFRMHFPATGRYRSVLEYNQYNWGGAADVYLIPVPQDGESVEDSLTDDWKLGSMETLNPEAGNAPIVTQRIDDAIIEEPGDYLLVFRQTRISGGQYLLLRGATFSGTSPIVSVTRSKGDALELGETARIEADIQWERKLPAYLDSLSIAYENKTPEILSLSDGNLVTALKEGVGEIEVTAFSMGYSTTGTCSIAVGSGKARRSYYTDQKVANAQNNIQRYDWARTMRDTAVASTDYLFDYKLDTLWEMMPSQELPRSTRVGYRYDPGQNNCLYCGKNLLNQYGSWPWLTNPLAMPWKIQCPDCRRQFPSNDFGEFYQLGIDEHGDWRYQQALAKNAELVAKGESGYLVNILYPEKEDNSWGVDDGWGFKIGNECKSFIAFYHFQGIWDRTILRGLKRLRDAYLYTNDIKYGRMGAILLDRVADRYPDFDATESGAKFLIADGGVIPSRGKISGCIDEYYIALPLAQCYDAFWPATSDPQVISFLSQKAQKYQMENPKTSRAHIVRNMENGLLREINRGIRDHRINSNFGHPQQALMTAAVALDTMPETKEWIDFTFKSGGRVNYFEVDGGNVYAQLVNVVDRDGHGSEGAPNYNKGWVSSMIGMADILQGYDKYPEADLYKNPKVIRMLTAMMDVTMVSRESVNVGDNETMGSGYQAAALSDLVRAYEVTGDEDMARMVYIQNGQKTDGIHGSIFDAEPEAIKRGIEQAVEKSLRLEQGSRNLAGYGLAVLRDGDWIRATNSVNTLDTQRDFYIYYGRSSGHGHPDKLTLGVHSYGLDMGADLGMPEVKTTEDPHRNEFIEQTITHNTVTVDNKKQIEYDYGDPMHFDDAGQVKLMDVSAPQVYDATDAYRRTLVMVNASDEVSYGVDFFHVRGGSDHNYSFHALGDTAELTGVNLVGQKDEEGNYIGSYKDVNKAWGSKGSTNSWFGEVDTASDPGNGNQISMDWKITDYHSVLKPARPNLHLRLTMLNSFLLDEVTMTSGIPPKMKGAPESIKFLFARHTGENDAKAGRGSGTLESLFTSVVEPYDGERYIESIENVDVTRLDGEEFTMDEAKAVKVTLTNGRQDYIVYAKDNTVGYRVGDLFDFRGFVGVVSAVEDEISYTYVNDGDTIAEQKDLLPAVTGTVQDFQKELSEENYITIAADQAVDPAELQGQYIYVENTRADNAAYRIESAEAAAEGIRLNLGNTTLIASFANDKDFSKGYRYNIEAGQSFRIPLSYVQDGAPVFDPLTVSRATAGKSVSMQVHAVSPLDRALTYRADILPRGASFNEDTQTFSWTPDNAQIGQNIVKFTASDGARETSILGTIRVYQGGNSGTGSGPAGPGTEPEDKPGKEPGDDPGKEPGDDPGKEPEDGPAAGKRFVDLGGYGWAEEAVYALVERGVVQGTSETTYSPASPVTRADFAVLLVRAFGLTGSGGRSFADVPADAYYAKEVAIAKEHGIIGGIGNDRFAPEAPIKREDMMLILDRILEKMDGPMAEADEAVLAQYADGAQVSAYARQAVAQMVGAQLVAGSNGYLHPQGKTTRAEVAVLLNRILNGLESEGEAK